MSAEALLEEARKLSSSERMRIAEELWNSVWNEKAELPLTNEQREELDRRLDNLAANPDVGSPWEEVRARIERKL
jgi:putative addiction module component (TIGR02574 family)